MLVSPLLWAAAATAAPAAEMPPSGPDREEVVRERLAILSADQRAAEHEIERLQSQRNALAIALAIVTTASLLLARLQLQAPRAVPSAVARGNSGLGNAAAPSPTKSKLTFLPPGRRPAP